MILIISVCHMASDNVGLVVAANLKSDSSIWLIDVPYVIIEVRINNILLYEVVMMSNVEAIIL